MSAQFDDWGEDLQRAVIEEALQQRAQEFTDREPAPPTAPLTRPATPPAQRTAWLLAKVVLLLGLIAAATVTVAVLKAQQDTIEQTRASIDGRLEELEQRLTAGLAALADRTSDRARLDALEAELRQRAQAHAALHEDLRRSRGSDIAVTPAAQTLAPQTPAPQPTDRERDELRRLNALLQKQRN